MTYLRNEDTTKAKDWLNEIQAKWGRARGVRSRNAESRYKHAGTK